MESRESFFEGKSAGQWIADGLQEFADVLKNDRKKVSKEFTCHKLAFVSSPATYDAALVKKTRKILGASQTVFAQFLGVAVNTVRSWEQGVNVPRDSACRLMDEIRHNPMYWRERLCAMIVAKKPRARKTVSSSAK